MLRCRQVALTGSRMKRIRPGGQHSRPRQCTQTLRPRNSRRPTAGGDPQQLSPWLLSSRRVPANLIPNFGSSPASTFQPARCVRWSPGAIGVAVGLAKETSSKSLENVRRAGIRCCLPCAAPTTSVGEPFSCSLSISGTRGSASTENTLPLPSKQFGGAPSPGVLGPGGVPAAAFGGPVPVYIATDNYQQDREHGVRMQRTCRGRTQP